MQSKQKVLEEVLTLVSPTPEELKKEKAFAHEIIKKLENGFAKGRVKARIQFIGSAARDTGLRGTRDIDLFIAFPKKMTREEIFEIVKKIAFAEIKEAKWEMHYAEHPYLQAVIKGFSVEVIPCFEIQPQEKIKSAVDRSPLHMIYLEKNLNQIQKGEVRLLKKLMKTAGIYGAEAEIKGFSGVMCEYLMLYYSSLENLMEGVANWKLPVFIDASQKISKEMQDDLLKQFQEFPIILPDPVDFHRNTAAAISLENACKFILLARNYANKFSKTLFVQSTKKTLKPVLQKLLKKRNAKFAVIEMEKPAQVHDIIMPQLHRSEKNIAKQCEMHEFQLSAHTSFATDSKTYIFLEFEKFDNFIKKMQGPEIENAIACKAFLQAQKNALRVYVEGNRLMADKKPEFSNAIDLLNAMKKQPLKAGISQDFIEKMKKSKIKVQLNLEQQALQKIHDFLTEKH